jgi:hypothetical protein
MRSVMTGKPEQELDRTRRMERLLRSAAEYQPAAECPADLEARALARPRPRRGMALLPRLAVAGVLVAAVLALPAARQELRRADERRDARVASAEGEGQPQELAPNSLPGATTQSPTSHAGLFPPPKEPAPLTTKPRPHGSAADTPRMPVSRRPVQGPSWPYRSQRAAAKRPSRRKPSRGRVLLARVMFEPGAAPVWRTEVIHRQGTGTLTQVWVAHPAGPGGETLMMPALLDVPLSAAQKGQSGPQPATYALLTTSSAAPYLPEAGDATDDTSEETPQ